MNEKPLLAQEMLKVEELCIDYYVRGNKIPAVRNISFDVFRGETFGLVGESGSGKSTVGYGIMGYTAENGIISHGRVFFKGKDLTRVKRKDLRNVWGHEIAIVSQDPESSLNPSMRVGDQISEILGREGGLSSSKARQKAIELFESLRLRDPEITARSYPHELSGGMKQRTCIAMALALEPELLIMDEPTTALDVTTEAVVLDLVNSLKMRFRLSILYITHNLGVVAKICDRVGVMYVGKLVEEAPVGRLFRNPRHPYTMGLLECIPKLGETKRMRKLRSIPGTVAQARDLPKGCSFSPRCAFFSEECAESEPELVERETAHRSSCDVSHRCHGNNMTMRCQEQPQNQKLASFPTNSGVPMLRVEHLRHYYRSERGGFVSGLWSKRDQIKAVDDVSFDLHRSSTLAVVGESGCGKSTLARCIMGFLKTTQGLILFDGENLMVPVEQRERATLNKISMVFQNPESTLNPKHTIGYTIGRPLRLAKGLKGYTKHKEVRRYLDAVNLSGDYEARLPRELSGGEKQRVAIARALASDPEMIICDEPTSALDVSVQASVLTLLLDLQTKLRTAYLFISHDLSVVRYLSDYIAVMYVGKFCEIGTAEETFNPPYHPYTEALLSAIPIADPEAKQKTLRLTGSVPSLLNPPTGCRFHTRCHRKIGRKCEEKEPAEMKISPTHKIYCHLSISELMEAEPVIFS